MVEAAFAGALGVRLGGRNVYRGRVEERGVLGDGRAVAVGDIDRANRLAGDRRSALAWLCASRSSPSATVREDGAAMTVLILGGTAEARALAAALVHAGQDVLTSLAGRVRDPALPPGRVRIGGFGGVDGLAAFLRTDGGHRGGGRDPPVRRPDQRERRRRGREAGVPLLRLERPGWADHPRRGRRGPG